MEWLFNNWVDVFNTATAIVTAASLVANLTPTKRDDEAVNKVAKVIHFFALNFRIK